MSKNKPYKQRLINFDEEIYSRIMALRAEMGVYNDSDMIRMAINSMYRKTFPAYTNALKDRNDPARKAEREVQVAEAKEKTSYEKGKSLCDQLSGTTEQDADGYLCRFNTYSKGGPNVFVGEMRTRFEELSELTIRNQYKGGTKEEILEKVEKGEAVAV